MKTFISFLALFFSINAFSSNEDSVLVEENNFQELGEEMKRKSLGLVLMLHAEHCSYCALMEDEILAPMVIGGDYDDKVLIRKLQIDESRDVINFSGKTVEPYDISSRYNASLTPTLVFLDHKGNELVKQMVGINTIDYFGAYLDVEIDKLNKKINLND